MQALILTQGMSAERARTHAAALMLARASALMLAQHTSPEQTLTPQHSSLDAPQHSPSCYTARWYWDSMRLVLG
eukprot:1575967-Rhodomonas_salina.1